MARKWAPPKPANTDKSTPANLMLTNGDMINEAGAHSTSPQSTSFKLSNKNISGLQQQQQQQQQR